MCCFLICLSLHAELLASLWNFLTRKIGNFSFVTNRKIGTTLTKYNSEQNISNWLFPDHRDSSQSRPVKYFVQGRKRNNFPTVSLETQSSYLAWCAPGGWSVVVCMESWLWVMQALGSGAAAPDCSYVDGLVWNATVGNTWLMLLVTIWWLLPETYSNMWSAMTVAMVKLR